MSNSPHKKNLEAEVRLFCNDFSAFCDWDGEASREKYADMNDIEIKVIAEEILIDAADRKLDAEEVPANPHDAQKARWIADLASGFNEKRSTLERLGLVSGGYDKFFKKADKRRKENEKTIAA
ncbi:MAG: hypothetical protein Q7R59_02945 [bacterium]|nr:hypothetical protein [bacterium]